MSAALPAEESASNMTLLQGLAKVMQDQLELRRVVEILKERIVTKEDVERIISGSFMTRQEFKEQRDKDLVLWQKSRRWFYGVLGGCGCSLIVGMLFTSLISAGIIWSIFHFWLH